MMLKSILETVLFVHGEPISLDTLSRIARVPKEEVSRALSELEDDYATRGLALLEKNGEWQLGAHPENAPYITALLKEQLAEELSKASVETLAIIAYKGPLTRTEIEYIRGVNSSFILRNLLLRGLVERIENPKDARSFLYRASFDLLKYLGVRKLEELPGYTEFQKGQIEVLESRS